MLRLETSLETLGQEEEKELRGKLVKGAEALILIGFSKLGEAIREEYPNLPKDELSTLLREALLEVIGVEDANPLEEDACLLKSIVGYSFSLPLEDAYFSIDNRGR